MKNFENSRTILNPTTGLFLTHCVQQLLQSRLAFMSQTMISACRRSTMDNCLPFLLGRKLILLCCPLRAEKKIILDKLASSRAQTVSLTTAATWCGILNKSKSAGSSWYDTLHVCSCQNGQSIKAKKLSGITKKNWITSWFMKYHNSKISFGRMISFLRINFIFLKLKYSWGINKTYGYLLRF